jgi:hypothetical protein
MFQALGISNGTSSAAPRSVSDRDLKTPATAFILASQLLKNGAFDGRRGVFTCLTVRWWCLVVELQRKLDVPRRLREVNNSSCGCIYPLY